MSKESGKGGDRRQGGSGKDSRWIGREGQKGKPSVPTRPNPSPPEWSKRSGGGKGTTDKGKS